MYGSQLAPLLILLLPLPLPLLLLLLLLLLLGFGPFQGSGVAHSLITSPGWAVAALLKFVPKPQNLDPKPDAQTSKLDSSHDLFFDFGLSTLRLIVLYENPKNFAMVSARRV